MLVILQNATFIISVLAKMFTQCFAGFLILDLHLSFSYDMHTKKLQPLLYECLERIIKHLFAYSTSAHKLQEGVLWHLKSRKLDFFCQLLQIFFCIEFKDKDQVLYILVLSILVLNNVSNASFQSKMFRSTYVVLLCKANIIRVLFSFQGCLKE